MAKRNPDDYQFSRLRFLSKAQRYFANGRFVKHENVLRVINHEIDERNKKLVAIGEEFRAELARPGVNAKVAAANWRVAMAAELKRLHVSEGMAAVGGKERFKNDAAARGRVGGLLRVQYEWLDKFAAQVAANPAIAQTDDFLRRVRMYGAAGRATYERQRHVSHKEQGYTHARRVLHAKESCAACIAAAARGWVLIDEVSPIGTLSCRTNCRCTIIYKKAVIGEEWKTVKQAEEWAAEHGIDADYGDSLVAARFFNEAFREMADKGLVLPPKIEVDAAHFADLLENTRKKTLAQFVPPQNPANMPDLKINPEAEFWESEAKARKIAAQQGGIKEGQKYPFWATQEPLHAARQEMGHWQHYQKDRATYRKWAYAEWERDAADALAELGGRDGISANISRYAAFDPGEFVAEVFAGLMAGKKYSSPTMKWYMIFGGVIP